MSRICPDCNNEYNSGMDICYNCYKKLKKQYTEEAKKEMEKYYRKEQEEWSSMYKYATTDLMIYGEDDFGTGSQKSIKEQLLYYFTKRYVKEKIREHCKPIREKREQEQLKKFKQFLIQTGIHDEMKEIIKQSRTISKDNN